MAHAGTGVSPAYPRGPWGPMGRQAGQQAGAGSQQKTGAFGFLYSGGDFDIAVLKGEFSITK